MQIHNLWCKSKFSHPMI